MAIKSPSVYGAIRSILATDLELPADTVIAKVQAQGIKASKDSIRNQVHTARSAMRKLAGTPAPAVKAAAPSKPAAANGTSKASTSAAKPTSAPTSAPKAAAPAPSLSSVLRPILLTDLDMPADLVIQKARANGVTEPTEKIRNLTKNLRNQLKTAARKAPVAAKATPAVKPVMSAKPTPNPVMAVAAQTTAAPKPTAAASVPSELSAVLENVGLVNKVVTAGGVDQARQVAAAVKACGGVEAFLQHVELVVGIRNGETA